VGSTLADTPTILEMVAVGAMATQFELRMPCCLMRARKAFQSMLTELSTSTKPPRDSRSNSRVSCGKIPLSHQAAAIAGVAGPRSSASSVDANRRIANGFHGAVGKLDCSFRGIRHAHFMQAILKAHDPHAHRTMLEVGVARLVDRVIVDVDHVSSMRIGGGIVRLSFS